MLTVVETFDSMVQFHDLAVYSSTSNAVVKNG